MTIDLTSVLNTDIKFVLIVHEDVSNVHFSDGKLCLRATSLACHVQCKTLFRTGDVAEGCAGVVIGTLRAESHTARDLCVWPNLSLERLDREYFILEEHGILIYCFSNRLIFACQSCNGSNRNKLKWFLTFDVTLLV
jgi:hypothetical protein